MQRRNTFPLLLPDKNADFRPESPHPPGTVLDRLGDVGGLDILISGQIGDGAGQLEDAMVGPGAEPHLLHRCFEQIGAGSIERAKLADFRRPHIGIGLQAGAVETFALKGAGGLDALAHGLAGFAGALAAQLLKRHARHLHMNIYPVHEWAGYFFLVAFHHRDGAGALFFGIGGKTAGAGVHRANQNKVGRIGQRAGRAADRHDFVFQRLAQHFQHAVAKLRQFVQKEHAAMGQADFAGFGPASATDKAGVAHSVVRSAERPVADQRFIGGQLVGHGVDAGYVERLGDGQFGQNTGHRAGNECFARAGRPAEEQVVRPGRGHFQRSFGMFLPLNTNVKRHLITLRLSVNLNPKICQQCRSRYASGYLDIFNSKS